MNSVKFFLLPLTIISFFFLISITSCSKKGAETAQKKEKSSKISQTAVEKPASDKPKTAEDVANQHKFMSDINNKDVKSGDDEAIAKRIMTNPTEANENKVGLLLDATNEFIRQYCDCKKQTDSAKRSECDKNMANMYEQMMGGLNDEQRAVFKYTFSRGTKNCNQFLYKI